MSREVDHLYKSLSVIGAALFLVAGCVTVGPNSSGAPTFATSGAPSLGVTTPAPSTLAPTTAPTLAPTLAPPPTLTPTATPLASEAPTTVPTMPPSAEPTAQASSEPGSRDLVFDDDFTDPSSGWDVLDEDFASISYDTGVLALRFNDNSSWAFSVRQFDGPQTTVVQAATFEPDSDGIFGLLCGDSGSATYYGAVVSTDGSLVFIETDNGTVNVLDRQDNLGLNVTIGASNALALECSVTIDGVVQMVVGMQGTGPVGVYRQTSNGLSAFDVTGIYGEAASDGYTLAVDSAAVWGVGGADGTMSDGAQLLFAHIPSDLQQNCYESPIWNTDADFVVTCMEQTKGKGAELAEYLQYSDAAGMATAYQGLVTAFGVESQGSCKSGPNEASWQANEQTSGRVQCAPQTVGIRFDWTDDMTSILSTMIDFEGSYKDTYDQWVDAGPIIPQG